MTITYGTLKDSYWKARLTTDLTDANKGETAYKIEVLVAGPYASGGWVNYPFTCTVDATGQTAKSYTSWQERLDKGEYHDFVKDNFTWSFSRGHSDKTIKVWTNVKNTYTGSISKAEISYKIPARRSVKISYDAKGGSNAPSAQTKWYGETLKLSTTKPTKTGYTFKGWSTSSAATTVNYNAGASYTSNPTSSFTLYAVWQANTYTWTFDANGGAGSSTKTATYNTSFKFNTVTSPTRTGYNFAGWATSAGGDVAYSSGSALTVPTGAKTFYAVWTVAFNKAVITSLKAERSSGSTPQDEGVNAKITVTYAFNDAASVTIKAEACVRGNNFANLIGNQPSATVNKGSNTTGTSALILNGAFDKNTQYDIRVTITGGGGTDTKNTYLSRAYFTLDFGAGGYGIGVGQPAPAANSDDPKIAMAMQLILYKALQIRKAEDPAIYLMTDENDPKTNSTSIYRNYGPTKNWGTYIRDHTSETSSTELCIRDNSSNDRNALLLVRRRNGTDSIDPVLSELICKDYVTSVGDNKKFKKWSSGTAQYAGYVTITPSAANTPTAVTVTWPAAISNPMVVVSAQSGVPGKAVTGVSFSAQTSTQCNIWLCRTNTTATNVYFMVM